MASDHVMELVGEQLRDIATALDGIDNRLIRIADQLERIAPALEQIALNPPR